jgi:NAD(P)-dependent dehydrogenase (short-subunit alcohol dehydrogenase family)
VTVASSSRFAGCNAVVVGAGAAIGRAAACRLAGEGASVVVVDHAGDDLSETAGSVGEAGGEVLAVEADPADEAQLRAAAEACAQRCGSVDVLVNHHLALAWCDVMTSSMAIWHEAVRVNLLGPVVATRMFLPLLEAAGTSAVVHVGSIDGILGNPRAAAYSTTKGALVSLTHVMADELAPRGIRVNCVARAAADDGAGASASPVLAVEVARHTPLRRVATAAEVAAVICFLASADASYVNGAVLPVDGGRSGVTPGTAWSIGGADDPG